MRFEGTKDYVATEDLKVAVNAAITLERPLLVKGEPGTGKTQLAQEVARALDAPLIEWHVKSTSKAQHGRWTCPMPSSTCRSSRMCCTRSLPLSLPIGARRTRKSSIAAM